MHLVYIALGSNLGNRSGNLIAAIQYLGPEVRVKKCSAVYETPPWGYEDQPKFLNQVLEVETDLAPGDLLDHVKKIESDVGREVSFRYGPRSIDIDILFFDYIRCKTCQISCILIKYARRAYNSCLAPRCL